jgi:hypothetical protein
MKLTTDPGYREYKMFSPYDDSNVRLLSKTVTASFDVVTEMSWEDRIEDVISRLKEHDVVCGQAARIIVFDAIWDYSQR